MIHPSASVPIAATITAKGDAIPAPFPDAPNPAINGIKNAALNTGPMKPTDCAMTSTSVRRFSPRRS